MEITSVWWTRRSIMAATRRRRRRPRPPAEGSDTHQGSTFGRNHGVRIQAEPTGGGGSCWPGSDRQLGLVGVGGRPGRARVASSAWWGVGGWGACWPGSDRQLGLVGVMESPRRAGSPTWPGEGWGRVGQARVANSAWQGYGVALAPQLGPVEVIGSRPRLNPAAAGLGGSRRVAHQPMVLAVW